jgi:molybdopterin-guanine dinucleotide biosynthesis protein A
MLGHDARAPVYGLVLCGGLSRRMGRDKAREELGGRTLIEAALAALEPVCDEVWLASGTPPRYPELGRAELADRIAGAGPLAGIEAGLARAEERDPRAWLCVRACDLPAAGPGLFERLLGRAAESGAEAVLFRGPAGVEPLCAVYSAALRARARAALEAGRFKATSFLDGARVAWLEAAPAGEDPARNLNTPEELERERALAGRRVG